MAQIILFPFIFYIKKKLELFVIPSLCIYIVYCETK